MLFVTAGLLSLAVAASLLLSQRDYKRMLAYHSVEHMGLIALGAAAGTHSPSPRYCCTCSATAREGRLFLASGEILIVEARPRSTGEGVARSSSGPRGVFAFGLVTLLGLPPFSLFISELNMLRAEVHVGLGWVAAISLVLMAVIFVQ